MANENEVGERVAVPLVMLPGNMEVLLEQPILVSKVSLHRYEAGGELPIGLAPDEEAVVLMFHFGAGERELALQAGMKFGGLTDE
jgi:hypothetical protein